MTVQDLQDGLRALAAPVTRGVSFDDVAGRVRRGRRRRVAAGATLVVAATAGGLGWTLRPAAPDAHQLATGPERVELSPFVTMQLKHDIGPFDGTGVVLSRFGPLTSIGVQANGWTCIVLRDGRREGNGDPRGIDVDNGCAKPSRTGSEQPEGRVIYPGFGVASLPDGSQRVTVTGSAPAGTTHVTLTASDGRTVDVPVFDAGASFDHRAFFAVDWVSGTTVIRAYDDAGEELACGRTAKVVPCEN